MLFVRLIIITFLLGIIDQVNIPSISNCSYSNTSQFSISKTKSQQNKAIGFVFEETYFEQEDENESDSKKHSNNKQSDNQPFLIFTTSISFFNATIGNKYFFNKQLSVIPLYLSFGNFRI